MNINKLLNHNKYPRGKAFIRLAEIEMNREHERMERAIFFGNPLYDKPIYVVRNSTIYVKANNYGL